MQFKIPLKYSDLNLGQLMTLHTESDPYKRVSACSDVTLEQLREARLKDVQRADEYLKTILSEERGKHLKKIKVKGEQYGFIPNWSEFSLGEWIDIEEYCGDFWNNAHKVASILYRPIVRSQGDVYTIEKYTTKEDAEIFKEMPADIFGGCMLFFSTSRRELLSTMKSSLMEGIDHQIHLLRSGIGMPSSTPYQVRMSSKWMRFLTYLSGLLSPILPSKKTLTIK
jgi:hypothetical protein